MENEIRSMKEAFEKPRVALDNFLFYFS